MNTFITSLSHRNLSHYRSWRCCHLCFPVILIKVQFNTWAGSCLHMSRCILHVDVGRHLGAQRGERRHLMLSESHREKKATVRHCLTLIDSGYSLAADADQAVHPRVLSLWFPWCLKYAFVLTWYKFDTSVLKLLPNPPRGWALTESWRYTGCHSTVVFLNFQYFKDPKAMPVSRIAREFGANMFCAQMITYLLWESPDHVSVEPCCRGVQTWELLFVL